MTDDENFTYTKKLQNELEDVILIIILFSLVDKESFEYAKTLIGFIKNSLMNNKLVFPTPLLPKILYFLFIYFILLNIT